MASKYEDWERIRENLIKFYSKFNNNDILSKSKDFRIKDFIICEHYTYTSDRYTCNKKWFNELFKILDYDLYKDLLSLDGEFIVPCSVGIDEFIESIMLFWDYYNDYIDPRFYNSKDILNDINKDAKILKFDLEEAFVEVSYEVTSIPKTSKSSIFDSIIGLDKMNETMIFCNMIITNKISNNKYEYSFTKGEDIKFDSPIYEEQFNKILKKIGKSMDLVFTYYMFNSHTEFYKFIKDVIFKYMRKKRLGKIFDEWMGVNESE